MTLSTHCIYDLSAPQLITLREVLSLVTPSIEAGAGSENMLSRFIRLREKINCQRYLELRGTDDATLHEAMMLAAPIVHGMSNYEFQADFASLLVHLKADGPAPKRELYHSQEFNPLTEAAGVVVSAVLIFGTAWMAMFL